MTNEANGLLRVTRVNIKPAALTLARAFQEYPESVYFMPDETKRRKQHPLIYQMVLKDAISHSEVLATSPKMEGVAVWQLVDGNHPAYGRRFSFRWWWASLFIDKETNKRQKIYFEYVNTVRTRVMPERYWFLQILGVDPRYQGLGFSSRLLIPLFERADREGLPCFLDTQDMKNVRLYEHFGFKVAEEGIIPGSKMHSWAMVREYEQPINFT